MINLSIWKHVSVVGSKQMSILNIFFDFAPIPLPVVFPICWIPLSNKEI